MLAILWAATGSLFKDNLVVPTFPNTPQVICTHIYERISMIDYEKNFDGEFEIQMAEFTLTDYSPTGEVAHYDLSNGPPKGWEWLIQKDKIIARKLPLDKNAAT